jgi:putative nucleotidyltransferase with HDIG domain
MEELLTNSIQNDLIHLEKQYSLDVLDDWVTTAGLIESALSMTASAVPGSNPHIFVHVSEAHEFREIDREGLSSIPDDSLFTACLTMQSAGSLIDDVFSDYNLNDSMLHDLLRETYNAQFVIPIVHRFSLLAFILISVPELSGEQHSFMNDLTARLKINLYAASIADNRQRELIELSEYPEALHRYENLGELIKHLLDDVAKKLSFDYGIYYHYDEYLDLLIPDVWITGGVKPDPLSTGKGISGLTLERKRASYIPDREKHPSYSFMAEEKFIQGSFISVPVQTDKRVLGVITLCRESGKKGIFGVEHRYMLEILTTFLATEMNSRLLYAELEESYFSTVSSLTRALEAKDHYTRGHSERVMKYAVGIAQALNLSYDSIRRIRYAAILHDIGKIGISDSIITKTSSLTDAEYKEIKKHTEIGYDIVNDSGFFSEIRDLIRYHHEKIDGTGYYEKRPGDYPWEAMIISLADIYDALASDRPYRKAYTHEEALVSLEKLVGINFDQKIFNAFKDWMICETGLKSQSAV